MSEVSSDQFKGRVAVITGAASGFGLEASRIAARRGMKVVMVDVQPDALELAAHEVEGLGTQVMARRVDVSKADEVDALAAAVHKRFGAPHLVFNNAGVAVAGLIWEHTAKDWEWVCGVNLMGVAHGVRAFTPLMLAAAQADPAYQGHIVNTASMAGLVSPPNLGVYNATKHAVVAISETLHQDLTLVTDQVHAHVLCPYFVATGIHESHRNRPAAMQEPNRQPTRSELIAQAMVTNGIAGAKVTASQVAALVFEAVVEGRFYIYSHPQALGPVQTRMDDVVQCRNPSDPFADRPQVRQGLYDALRAR